MRKGEITSIVAFTMCQLELEYGIEELESLGALTCDEIVADYIEQTTPVPKDITIEDVLAVSKQINKALTHKEVLEIIANYPEAQKKDPHATWNLVVEDMIWYY